MEVAIRREWALQFCLLFLTDMPGASLELLLNYAWGECRDHSSSPGHSRSISGMSGCGPVPPLPLAGSSLVTHSQALLPDLCLMQVDNSCLFCSALKIRWLLALFPHAEELTLSHILLCLPLSYTSGLRPSSPGCPWPQCSVRDDGVLCSSRGPVAGRATLELRLPEII